MPAKKAKRKGARKPGRPSKIAPEVVEAACDAARLGLSMSATAALAGVSVSSLNNWLRRGRNSTHGAYREFLAAFSRARAEGERRLVGMATDPEAKNWRGSAFVLEKRWRAEYGSKTDAERRKLEAEAELLEAKAELARAARDRLTGDLIVMLDDGDGGDTLAGDLSDEELADLIVSELKS